ncbi:hypothetical protein GXP70_05005 [Paenibacillus lycopersici]|uniref:Uncharacterized protein n=1 Tax=Paenibacillus lycopersici TaxID=2704462 RepID=A0A6C0FV95_9BACL|nr:hypothetical protein [Paenibacillus lycopersici]QHT59391.1 hypothetical protein GXP70_05005 [Paenibacillus lycopersici]
MATYQELDIDSVVRIGLMYLDGDRFEEVLLDRHGHTDYDFARFTDVKNDLTRLENINPQLGLCAVLWQLHPANRQVAVPVVAGKSLPLEDWTRSAANPELLLAMESGRPQVKKRDGRRLSRYYPVRNSDDEIVGVLELLQGMEGIADL